MNSFSGLNDCASIYSIFCGGDFFGAIFFFWRFSGSAWFIALFGLACASMFIEVVLLLGCPCFNVSICSTCVLSFNTETRGFALGKCLYATKFFRAAALHFPYTRVSGTKARPSCLITRGYFPFSRIQAVRVELLTLEPFYSFLNCSPKTPGCGGE